VTFALDSSRIVIVNEYSLVECMDRTILMQDRTIADIGTLEQLKRTHDLDLEVFTKVKEEEVEDVDLKVIFFGMSISIWGLLVLFQNQTY
jgi:SHS2 domain-containing protein